MSKHSAIVRERQILNDQRLRREKSYCNRRQVVLNFSLPCQGSFVWLAARSGALAVYSARLNGVALLGYGLFLEHF